MTISKEIEVLTPESTRFNSITDNEFTVPFTKRDQLNSDFDQKIPVTDYLPGQPRVRLDDKPKLANYLKDEFIPYDLETLAPHLWMMTTQSPDNIWSLHSQRILAREIIITEEPKLHLTWAHERIFIKPLPAYLLSHSFWRRYLVHDGSGLNSELNRVRRAILGYVRTYSYLVRHESDFDVAKNLRLIPPHASWPDFCAFISGFEKVMDHEVSPRYCFGEIRLTRLNFYSKVLFFKSHYHRIHGQYSDYFSRFFGPFLFVFGMLSIVLDSMQVGMAVEGLTSWKWEAFWNVSRWFCVVCILLTFLVALSFLTMLGWKIADEWIYAGRDRRRLRKEEQKRKQSLTSA